MPKIEERVSCAWCNEEQGKPQGEGSHSICKRHVKQVEAEYQRIKNNRKEKARC